MIAKPHRDEAGNIIRLDLQLSDKKEVEEFKTILNRALNCWADAPVEWKELSDYLEHGRILQDYRSQYPDKHSKKN